ncbi:MAG: PilZ domain-containing protein [Hoeflea sp.]|uniref:PilZ domain-containing protein n=1 Tax=Hoeflea sp. TaxID=1940281 RepID=UPI0027310504|nr:PilZ domain-containing protein [Hoeflea sp.]MDP2119256.1 PilZ domain-containing protein [Hoeflea sp.]
MSAPGNYLTRLAGVEQRLRKRRAINKLATVYYLRRGVRGYTSQPCRMVNISESGCLVAVPVPSQVADHLYLVIEGVEAKFSCAAVARSDNGLHLRFNVELATEIVDRLARKKLAPRRPANDS